MAPHALGTRLRSKLLSYILFGFDRFEFHRNKDIDQIDHLFANLSSLGSTEGFEAMVVIFPRRFKMEAKEHLSYDHRRKHKMVHDFAQRHGVEVFDLLEGWESMDPKPRDELYISGTHLSAKGMIAAADALLPVLRERYDLD
jgi:hypothetical protein